MKKITSVFLCLLMLVGCFALTSCSESTKTYSKSGFSITMSDDFVEKELVAYTYYLESTTAIMTALKEDFSTFEAVGVSTDISLKEYAELIVTANALDSNTEITESDGLTYFTYEKDVSGKSFFYVCYVFKGSNAFWSMNLACETSNKDEFTPKFNEWAKSVTVE